MIPTDPNDTGATTAGEDVSDQEMVDEVAGQTDSNLKAADVFERESDGASGDTEAAKADADELA
jgi:protease I